MRVLTALVVAAVLAVIPQIPLVRVLVTGLPVLVAVAQQHLSLQAMQRHLLQAVQGVMQPYQRRGALAVTRLHLLLEALAVRQCLP